LTIVPVTQITGQQLERARIEVEQKHELIKAVGEEHCADWIGTVYTRLYLEKARQYTILQEEICMRRTSKKLFSVSYYSQTLKLNIGDIFAFVF